MYMAILSDEQLAAVIKENEYVTEKQLQTAKQIATNEKISLYEALIEKDYLTDENLGEVIADFLKLPFISLVKVSIPQETLITIPEELARKYLLLAFSEEKNTLKIATAHPENTEVFQFIAQKTGMAIKLHYATEKDLTKSFRFYKKQLQEKFDDLLKEQLQIVQKSEIKDAPITKLVDLLIEYAYFNQASDVHIEPRADDSLTRFRIDGVLHDVLVLPKELHQQIIRRIKVLSKLRTDEYLSAQDGKMRIQLEQEDLDVRVSIVPVVQGEDAVLRL